MLLQLIRNNKGLTLIEVLLSIVILSVVLVTFFGFLTQSAVYTKKNEVKLDTMYVTQKVKNSLSHSKLRTKGIIDQNDNILINKINNQLDTGKITEYISGNQFTEYNITISFYQFIEDDVKLIKAKIVVDDPKNKKTSETFTYIRR